MTAREKILQTLEEYGYAPHSTLEDNQYCANRGVTDGAIFPTALHVRIATLQHAASTAREKRLQRLSQSMRQLKNGLRKELKALDSTQNPLKAKSVR